MVLRKFSFKNGLKRPWNSGCFPHLLSNLLSPPQFGAPRACVGGRLSAEATSGLVQTRQDGTARRVYKNVAVGKAEKEVRQLLRITCGLASLSVFYLW